MSYAILVDERYLESAPHGLLVRINPTKEVTDWIQANRTEEKFAYLRLGRPHQENELYNQWYCDFDDEEMALQFKLTFG